MQSSLLAMLDNGNKSLARVHCTTYTHIGKTQNAGSPPSLTFTVLMHGLGLLHIVDQEVQEQTLISDAQSHPAFKRWSSPLGC